MLKEKKLVQNLVTKDQRWKVILLEQWKNIIKKFNSDLSLEKIDHCTLIIGVSHSVLAQEVSMLSKDIIDHVNSYIDKHKIQKIIVRASNRNNKFIDLNNSVNKQKKVNNKDLSDRKRILKNIKLVETNEELKLLMEKFFNRCTEQKG
jgi:hypothetical protein